MHLGSFCVQIHCILYFIFYITFHTLFLFYGYPINMRSLRIEQVHTSVLVGCQMDLSFVLGSITANRNKFIILSVQRRVFIYFDMNKLQGKC